MAARCSVAEPKPEEIVAAARAWLGTPYVHQASCLGAGADCLGLVRGVWRALYGAEPEAPPAYSPDWSETCGREDLLAAGRRHLCPVPPDAVRAGDVLVFRMRENGPAKHLGILTTPGLVPGRIVHAYSGAAVCETSLGRPWLRRLAAAFRFPERGS